MYTAFLTQEMLDEAVRALGRQLTGNEVRKLDSMLQRESFARMKRSKDEIMASLQKVADRV